MGRRFLRTAGLSRLLLPLGLLLSTAALADGVLITRSFSGIWEQPDQESQGLVLQISADSEDEKIAVVYWFTFGEDLLSSWYLGVGPVDGDSIPMRLYQASGVEFMEPDGLEGDPNVEEIGTLTLEFHNCNQGRAYFDTPEEVLGAGEMRIKRLTSIYHMRCSGGPSDDTRGYGRPTLLEVFLEPAREGIEGEGKGKFWERPGRVDFKVEAEDLPDGLYALRVCEDADERLFDFEVTDGEGHIEFSDPQRGDKLPMDFDPRGCLIEILDGEGAVLTSGDRVLDVKDQGPHGPGHDDGADDEGIEIDLTSTGVIEGAEGEAEYESDDDNDKFTVKIKDVPVGFYPLWVGGQDVGTIEVIRMGNKNRGRIRFSEEGNGPFGLLDFPVFGQDIEVYDAGDNLILEGTFPSL